MGWYFNDIIRAKLFSGSGNFPFMQYVSFHFGCDIFYWYLYVHFNYWLYGKSIQQEQRHSILNPGNVAVI